MKIGKYEIDLGENAKPVLMGILNVTPDSFSDGGKFNNLDAAIKHTEELIKDGADIIDIGGESTRPGYTLLSDEEEISRVVPVIEKIKSEFDVCTTLDTYKSAVAKAGLDAGVDMINDVWGFKWDKNMAKVVADKGCGAILMHNRKNPEDYTDYMNDCLKDLEESINLAKDAGVDMDKIILDPGIGFAKTLEQNLIMMNHVDEVVKMGYPVLLGTSRKSMIGLTLDLPKDEREEGTIATSVMGYMSGCRIFRVHDVKKNKRALDMAYAIKNS